MPPVRRGGAPTSRPSPCRWTTRTTTDVAPQASASIAIRPATLTCHETVPGRQTASGNSSDATPVMTITTQVCTR